MIENDYINVYFNQETHNCIKQNIKDKNNIINNLTYDLKENCKKENINMYKIFKLFFYLLHKATINGLNDTLIKISRSEYLDMFGTYDKADIIENLKLLIGLTVKTTKKEGTTFTNVFSYVEEKDQEFGYIKARFTEEFYQLLKPKMFFPFNKSLFSINIKHNPNSFMLGMRLFYNKRVNNKNSRNNVISVKSLLDYCYFNTESIRYKQKRLTQFIRIPFEKDLTKLADYGITWEYITEPKSFKDFLNAKISYKINDYDKIIKVEK